MFLFKLHSPHNFIVGGGFFAHASLLPVSLAWESFGIANGANSLSEVRKRVARYRRQIDLPGADYQIGCILLEQPFFLSQDLWIPVPANWSSNIVQGKSYDLLQEPGQSLWRKLQQVLPINVTQGFHRIRESANPNRYGAPIIILPRLGQGSFRVLVTDAYQRSCAITGERTLPALDAPTLSPSLKTGRMRYITACCCAATCTRCSTPATSPSPLP